SSGLGGGEFRRKAYRATRNTRSRIDPARAIIPGIVQPRQRPTQRCSGNICRNDSVKYALASSTELKTRRPSSCRPQYRATQESRSHQELTGYEDREVRSRTRRQYHG